MPLAYTHTYHKIRDLEAEEDINIYLLQGGQSAGKNMAMAIILTERAEDEKIFRDTITIMTDTYDNLKDGAISDFETVFKLWGMDFYDYYNKQDKVCYYHDTKIQFRYLDDNKPQKGKGPRRGILYINEGNRVGWEAVKHYIARSREVYVDFNPDYEFWAHTKLEVKDNCKKIIVTYQDNQMCPKNEREHIESQRHDEEWFKVYGRGETGTYSERRMYQYQMASELPKTAMRLPNGMDFGSSPDPTCEVEVYLDGADLYLKEVFCENNLLTEKIKGAERDSIVDFKDMLIIKTVRKMFKTEDFKHDEDYYLGYDKEKYKDITPTPTDKAIMVEIQKIKKHTAIGDSSGATELRDLRKHGYAVRGVKKPKGSQMTGVNRMRSYNIKVLPESPNVVSGLNSWMRKIDKNGNIIPEPDGHEPDCLAAARYVMLAKAVW